MRSLKWTTSHAVFVTEIDDEHKEIFEALSNVQEVLAGHSPSAETSKSTQRLVASIADHFAHEERLMRASQYDSLRWHKAKHVTALRRVNQFVRHMEEGDPQAGRQLVEYLTSWLHGHTRLPDRMLGAFLRNQRSIWTLTFQAGTKPADACNWVDANGNPFDPPASKQRA